MIKFEIPYSIGVKKGGRRDGKLFSEGVFCEM